MIKADRTKKVSLGLSRLYIFSKARGAKREANFVTRNHETREKSRLVVTHTHTYKHTRTYARARTRTHYEWQNGLLGSIHDAKASFDQIEIARRFVLFPRALDFVLHRRVLVV